MSQGVDGGGVSVLMTPKSLSPPLKTHSGPGLGVLKPFFFFFFPNAKNGIGCKQNQVQEEPGSGSKPIILGSLPLGATLHTLLAPNRPTASWPATTSTWSNEFHMFP